MPRGNFEGDFMYRTGLLPTTTKKKNGRLFVSLSATLLAAPILTLAACGDDDDPMMMSDSSVMDGSSNTPDAKIVVPDAMVVDGEVVVPDAMIVVPDAGMDAEVFNCDRPGQTGPDCNDCLPDYLNVGGDCILRCDASEILGDLECGPGGTCAQHADDDEVSDCYCDDGYEGDNCEVCSTGFEPGNNDTCKLNLPPGANLMLWLDGETTTSLSVNDDDEVTNWHDRRPGIDVEADPPFGTARPKHLPNFRNGRGALLFDGTDDYLTVDGFTGMSGNDVEVIVAADPRTGSTGVFGAVSGTNNWAFMLNRVDASNNFEMIIRDPAASSGGESITIERTSPSRPMYLTGTRSTSSAPDSFFSFASDGVGDEVGQSHLYVDAQNSLTAPLNINIGRTQEGYLQGVVFEVLVYSKRLSTEERKEVTDYLRGKWNLQ